MKVANVDYRAEALSPSNGKISRDGSRPVRNRYADTQFPYQLLDGSGSLLWEHWPKFPRPHQLYLADDGWLWLFSHRRLARGGESVRVAPRCKPPEGPSVVTQNATLTMARMFWAEEGTLLFALAVLG